MRVPSMQNTLHGRMRPAKVLFILARQMPDGLSHKNGRDMRPACMVLKLHTDCSLYPHTVWQAVSRKPDHLLKALSHLICPFIKCVVHTLLFHQLLMGSFLHDSLLRQNQNAVRMADTGKTVRDGQCSAPF